MPTGANLRGVSLRPLDAAPVVDSVAARVVSPAPAGRLARVHDGVEEGLAARAAAGDAGAFDALVTLFGRRVFSVALRLLRDQGEAEDLAQEVFVALYHHLPDFRGESRLSTWIYRITKNRALNRLKFLSRRQHGVQADVDDPAVSGLVRDPDTGAGAQRDPEVLLVGQELSALLEHHLRQLPAEQD